MGVKKISKITQKVTSATQRALGGNDTIKGFAKEIVESHNTPQLPDVGTSYNKWVQRNLPDYIETYRLKRIQNGFKYKPLISIVICVNDGNIHFLNECFDSIMGQVYDNWQLCIVSDTSFKDEIKEIIGEHTNARHIKFKFLNKEYSFAKAINEGVKIVTGEYVAFCGQDDILWPNALHEVVKALNYDKAIDYIYTDEDKITEDRHNHLVPFFKPDWNPDFLHSINYTKNFSVIKTSLYEKTGGLRSEYHGAESWDLFLRIARVTTKIHHLPKVVYSQRVHTVSSVEPYIIEAQKRAIKDDIAKAGRADVIVEQDPTFQDEYWKVTYPLKDHPLVSIIIPSKNQYKIIKQCIESIYDKSTYNNFEIILVDTGSDDRKVLTWYKKIQQKHDNITIMEWSEESFSYARSCNEGARIARGEVLIMLNNDTEVITPEWIEVLAGDAQREEIGAVGCLLVYPDRQSIQHAGVGVGLGGAAANLLQRITLTQPMSRTQHIYVNTRHNITAVTAACMAIRKAVFNEAGGFDDLFRVTYNDIDLCLKLVEKGYRNLYNPHVKLVHYESISLGLPENTARRDSVEFEQAKELFREKWQKYIKHDPAVNSNLNKDNAFYDFQ